MTNRDCGIYLIENLVNGKLYVGSSRGIRKRWWEHLRTLRLGEHRNRYLQKSWTAHGEMAFRFSVVEHCNPEELHEREGWWMQLGASWKPEHGYNIGAVTGGPCSEEARLKSAEGRRGKKHTDEARARMSETQKKVPKTWLLGRPVSEAQKAKLRAANTGYQHTDEAKAKMSAARKGKPRPDLQGRKASEETRAKLSSIRKGRKASEETRAKMSAAQKARPHSPEELERLAGLRRGVKVSDDHKEKLSQSHKDWYAAGNAHPMQGKQHTEETKAKIGAAQVGSKRSEETRARMAAARQAWWEKRKLEAAHD